MAELKIQISQISPSASEAAMASIASPSTVLWRRAGRTWVPWVGSFFLPPWADAS